MSRSRCSLKQKKSIYYFQQKRFLAYKQVFRFRLKRRFAAHILREFFLI